MIVFFIILRNQQTLLTFLHEKCLFFMHVWILAHPYIYCKHRLSFHNQAVKKAPAFTGALKLCVFY